MTTEPNDTEQIQENVELMDQYVLRPLRKYEDKLVFTGWMEGNERELLSRAMTYARKVDHLVLQDLRHGYIFNSNIIVFITGTMGSGKSTLARSIAIQLREYCRKYLKRNRRIHFAFSNDETTKAVLRMKKGDILIQDEIGRQSGADSLTILKNIYNIQEQIRQEQLSFIFLSPTLKGQINACNICLEAWGIGYKTSYNRYRVYSGYTGKPLGWGEIPYLKDHEIERFYNLRKTEHVARLKRLQGASSVIWDKDELTKHARKLLKEMKKDFGIKEVTKDTKKFFTKANFMISISCGAIDMAGSAKKQEAVASFALRLSTIEFVKKQMAQKKLKKLADKGTLPDSMNKTEIIRKYGKHRFQFIQISMERDRKIVRKMFTPKYMHPFFKENNPKKLEQKYIDAYKMFYIDGVDASGVAKNFKISRSAVLNKYNKQGWLAVVDTEMIGWIVERVVKDLYYPKLNVYGGIEEPDLCDDIDNPTIMVEVKKRDEKKIPVVSMLSKKQIQHTINGEDSKLVILRMKGNEHIVELYDIVAT